MRRVALLFLAALAVSSCVDDGPEIPYANAPGTIYAPLRAPAPSPRGIAPTVLNVGDGVVCADPRLAGRRISSIQGDGGCGVASPVRVTQVAGVALSQPIRVNCPTARAFADWVEGAAKPAAAERSASLTRIGTVLSYACKTRNSRPGARLSEHAKGNAIDVGSFTFSDGEVVTVTSGWRGEGSAYLKRVHKAACGTFGTVLGPDSDRFHQNHFHLDTARHRGGPYCR